nr:hypothetical protein [Tanacetum cinerariifolium]
GEQQAKSVHRNDGGDWLTLPEGATGIESAGKSCPVSSALSSGYRLHGRNRCG